MDQIARHTCFEDASPDHVIVTLFRCSEGYVRGWYIGPVVASVAGYPSCTFPEDKLLGAVAVMRAWEIAELLGTKLSVVDPDRLWDRLTGENT